MALKPSLARSPEPESLRWLDAWSESGVRHLCVACGQPATDELRAEVGPEHDYLMPGPIAKLELELGWAAATVPVCRRHSRGTFVWPVRVFIGLYDLLLVRRVQSVGLEDPAGETREPGLPAWAGRYRTPALRVGVIPVTTTKVHPRSPAARAADGSPPYGFGVKGGGGER